jgi:hypothetical protein
MTFYSATGDFYDEKEFSKYTVNSTLINCDSIIKNNDKSSRRSSNKIKSAESVEHFKTESVYYVNSNCYQNDSIYCNGNKLICVDSKCQPCKKITNNTGYTKCVLDK